MRKWKYALVCVALVLTATGNVFADDGGNEPDSGEPCWTDPESGLLVHCEGVLGGEIYNEIPFSLVSVPYVLIPIFIPNGTRPCFGPPTQCTGVAGPNSEWEVIVSGGAGTGPWTPYSGILQVCYNDADCVGDMYFRLENQTAVDADPEADAQGLIWACVYKDGQQVGPCNPIHF